MLQTLNRFIDLVEKYVISVGFAVATLLLFTNVVLRYLFDTGLTWVLEAVQYLFAWVVLIGAAHGVKVGIHLGIDILVERFPPNVRRIVALISLLLCLVFVGAVDVLSIEYIVKIYQWGDLSLDLQIPQWIPYLAIPVGLTLMFYHFLHVGWLIWTGKALGIHSSEAAQALEELQK
ncbi:MAG: TRAP transporter small permease [Pseudomonadota bacterium]|nr:MAG: TRAP transporter small permease [Pseudomonadota bacterium]